MYCTRCGVEISKDYSYCKSCGKKFYFTGETSYYGLVSFPVPETAEMVYPSDPPRNPLIAFLLSFLVIGVGQMYAGQVTKGVGLFILALIISVLIVPHAVLGVWIISVCDAYCVARKLRRGLPVRQWEWF
jgi:TM2 domain-containing membrane protein YozV